MQTSELADAAFDEGLDLEVLFPNRPLPEMLWKASFEQVSWLQNVPICGDNEFLCHCSTFRVPFPR
jgi:hypothetical protein